MTAARERGYSKVACVPPPTRRLDTPGVNYRKRQTVALRLFC